MTRKAMRTEDKPICAYAPVPAEVHITDQAYPSLIRAAAKQAEETVTPRCGEGELCAECGFHADWTENRTRYAAEEVVSNTRLHLAEPVTPAENLASMAVAAARQPYQNRADLYETLTRVCRVSR